MPSPEFQRQVTEPSEYDKVMPLPLALLAQPLLDFTAGDGPRRRPDAITRPLWNRLRPRPACPPSPPATESPAS